MIDIRPIRITDVDACHHIVNENWGREIATRFLSEVTQVWAEDMENPPIYYVADSEGGEIVAFAGMMQSMIMFGIWDFIWINVKKEYQGSGIGRKLTEHRLQEIIKSDGRAVHLMTQSPAFFDQFGFEVIKEYNSWKLMSLTLGPVEM